MSNFYMLFVSLCFILRIQSTFLDIEELQNSKYGLEISAKPVLFPVILQSGIKLIKINMKIKVYVYRI